MGGGSGGDRSGHCVDVFQNKDDVKEVSFCVGCWSFGQSGRTTTICLYPQRNDLFVFFGRAPAGYKLQ